MSDNMQDKNGVLVQGHIKIFDPKSKEVYVEKGENGSNWASTQLNSCTRLTVEE